MNNYLLIGKYSPGNSILHRINPLVKLGLCLMYLISVFAAKGVNSYLVLSCYLIVLIILSQMDFKTSLRIFKPAIVLSGFLIIINGIYLGFLYWSGDFSHLGTRLVSSFYYILRLTLFMAIFQLLFFTTSPKLMLTALEESLQPLERFKFPLAEFSMMMLIAMRFLPILFYELDKIIMAKIARGDSYGGSLKQWIDNIISLINPLIGSIFRRVDEIAVALEIRGFQINRPRIRKQTKLRMIDIVVICISVVIFTISIITSY